MQNEELIPAEDFCQHHNIELSFIFSLGNSGLIHVSKKEEKVFVPAEELPQLERMVRWYYDMNINVEGIETIKYLLDKLNTMQQKINQLSGRLEQYES